ncbi:uncharacterized protein HMPREF1541_09774 [Cyphellophora europaea CBS 101466]|uniref:Zn(2)-C6 fungal-type domain-containing protein n=1 Tax=Cyphellophora europaea (strain CBS 101466) TaxID=1220924 RepID=W2SAI6_CYPE1|nr:uncharacterized protein HMPREF1541_09774 [Cyphellophora europaea CBS 101466]ETN44899.1 hypothetical protein HMPREF1541_09774 [Cyphellophora europaea CBS 101466]
MQSQTPANGLQRTACDRCRHHKLKCNRDEGLKQCRRCIRAGQQCLTGTARKAGRPQKLFRDSTHQAQSQHDPSTVLQTPPASVTDRSPASNVTLDYQHSASSFINPSIEEPVAQQTPSTEQQPPIDEVVDEISLFTKRSALARKLGDLQREVLVDADLVRGSRTVGACVSAVHVNEELGTPNTDFMVGRFLNHAKGLLEILDELDLSYGGTRNSDNVVTIDSKLKCDMPMMFSLMSCYICLIRIYRTVFSCLLDSIPHLNDPQIMAQKSRMQLLPSLDFGGYKINGRLDLQIQILVQVSEDLLYKLEDKFGIGRGTTTLTWQPTEGPTKATGLLWMMLEQEIAEQPPLDSPRGQCGSLKEILADIKKSLHMGESGNAS